MPTGLDMLVGSILKAAGVDPEKAKTDLANYGRALGDKITQLDASLASLRVEQEQTHAAVVSLADAVRQATRPRWVDDFLNKATNEGTDAAANRH